MSNRPKGMKLHKDDFKIEYGDLVRAIPTEYINDFIECKIYDLVKIVEPLERDKFKIKLF